MGHIKSENFSSQNQRNVKINRNYQGLKISTLSYLDLNKRFKKYQDMIMNIFYS